MRDLERMMKLAKTAERFRLDQARRAARLTSHHAQMEKLSRSYRDFLRNMRAFEKALGRDFLARNRELSVYLQRSAVIDRALRSHFRREAETMTSLAGNLARVVDPFPGVFSSTSDWASSLTVRMNALKQAWMLPDNPSLSLVGFARLSRLSDAVHTLQPYSAPLGELVAEELGNGYSAGPEDTEDDRDEAAVAAGLKPDLIAFPPSAYDTVTTVAGFAFHYDQMPPPKPEGIGEGGAEYNLEHVRLFTEIRWRLRHVVEKTLSEKFGPKWLEQGVPRGMRRDWKKRREDDRKAMGRVYPWIQYANFMDLRTIICRNWKNGFKPIFQSQNILNVSFQRLHSVRIAFGHGRPLCRAEVLFLVAEATHIFNVLRVPFSIGKSLSHQEDMLVSRSN